MLHSLFILVVLFFQQSLGLADEYEVSAPEIDVLVGHRVSRLSQAPFAVSLIEGRNLRRESGGLVSQSLRLMSGVNLLGAGGPSQIASTFIRGASADKTLFQLDGIPLNDPIHPSRSMDIGRFSSFGLGRVSVLKGSHGGIFGSNAMGGVVQLQSDLSATQSGGEAFLEGGSFLSARVGGLMDFVNDSKSVVHRLILERNSSEGYSIAEPLSEPEYRNGFQMTTLGLSSRSELSRHLVWESTIRYQTTTQSLPFQGGVGGADENYGANLQDVFARAELGGRGYDSVWNPRIRLGYVGSERSYTDRADKRRTRVQDSLYLSSRTFVHAHNASQWKFSETLQSEWIYGVELQGERAQFWEDFGFGANNSGHKTQDLLGVFLENPWRYENFGLHLALRQDQIQGLQDVRTTTTRVAPIWNLNPRFKLRGAYSTGFKAPTLYQLYSTFGNLTLNPEKSESFESGIDWDFGGQLSSTIFENRIQDEINYFPTSAFSGEYRNLGRTRVRGIETEVRTGELLRDWEMRISHTYLQARDLRTAQALLRRPQHLLQTSVTKVWNSWQYSLQARFLGRQEDIDFQGIRVVGGRYALLFFQAEGQILPNLALTLRVDNLLDRNVEELAGYRFTPRAVFVGLRASL
jgi:vitamin B12 transporter